MNLSCESPLSWPAGELRTRPEDRTYPLYKQNRTLHQEVALLEEELRRLGAEDVRITANVRVRPDGSFEPDGWLSTSNRGAYRHSDDPGAAVYFRLEGQMKCLPCDKWNRLTHNLHGITLSVEAIRALERHGCPRIVTKAFSGMTLLPAPVQWWEVLGLPGPGCGISLAEEKYRQLMKAAHPDRGGTEGRAAALNWAIERAREEIR